MTEQLKKYIITHLSSGAELDLTTIRRQINALIEDDELGNQLPAVDLTNLAGKIRAKRIRGLR